MASFYIDADDAFELIEDHGYMYFSLMNSNISGNFTLFSFDTMRLIRLPSTERLPQLKITADQVLQLSLLPNEEARTALTDAWKQELLGVKSDVSVS